MLGRAPKGQVFCGECSWYSQLLSVLVRRQFLQHLNRLVDENLCGVFREGRCLDFVTTLGKCASSRQVTKPAVGVPRKQSLAERRGRNDLLIDFCEGLTRDRQQCNET